MDAIFSKPIKKVFLFVIIVMFFAFVLNQSKVKRTFEENVEVIDNPLYPHLPKGERAILSLQEDFVIDFERKDLEEIGIREILSFDVALDGRIYFIVSRTSADLILAFDTQGEIISSFGRRGEGPGELEGPRFLRVDGWGRIQIADNARKMLFLFEKNGDLIEQISLPSNYQIATLLKNGNFLAMKTNFIQEEGKGERPIVLSDSDFEIKKILHPGKWMPNFVLAKKINPLLLYMDFNVLRVSNGFIYVGNYGSEYEFLVYDTGGSLQRKIRKKYQKVRVTDELKEQILSRAREEFYSFEQYESKVHFPDFYPPFQFFFLDETARLFVMTHEKGKKLNGYLYDVFDSKGVFIGRIELENYGSSPFSYTRTPVPLNVVAKNKRIYCLTEKENGYKKLIVFKIIWEK